jgi:hypothetical protein
MKPWMFTDGHGKMPLISPKPLSESLSGIGGQLSGFVQSARDICQMVAIDGCSVGCARAILKHADVPLKNYIVVTELGIEWITATDPSGETHPAFYRDRQISSKRLAGCRSIL